MPFLALAMALFLLIAGCISVQRNPQIVLRTNTIYFNGQPLYDLEELESKIQARLPELQGREGPSPLILEVCTDTVTVQQTRAVTDLLEKYGLVYSKDFHTSCPETRSIFSHRYR